MWRSPGFAALAAGSLAIGLGLAGALASVADAIVFRPLPVPDSSRLFPVFTSSAAQPLGFFSYPDFDDLRRAAGSAAIVAQTQVLVAIAREHGAAAQVRMGLAVTPDYFDVLRVVPALGRTFRNADAREGVVVLGHAFWKAQFGGDARVVGRRIELAATPFTVIGVAREDFALDRLAHEDFYVPIGVYEEGMLPSAGRPLEDRGRRFLRVYARLRGHAALAQAHLEIGAIGERLASEYPGTNRGFRFEAMSEPAARVYRDRMMPVIAGLLAFAGGLIVLAAAVNVAGVWMVRAEAGARDLAIQIAVGATRGRLMLEHLAASATVAIAGLLAAAPMAWAATVIFERAATLPSDLHVQIDAAPGARIVLIMIPAAGVATLICGLARVRARGVLVTVEIALATALVACGWALIGAISSTSRFDPGFRTDRLLTLALDPGQVRYGEARARGFYDQVLERVKNSALAESAPLGFMRAQRQIEIAGESSTIWINLVTPGYFDLLRIPIVGGRGFDVRDSASSPAVAIVNEELAKRCPVGSRFRMNGRMVEVAGVARNAKYFSIGERLQPFLYLPFAQNYASRMTLFVATPGNPATEARTLVSEIREIDPVQPVSEVRALKDYLTQGATFQARVALDAIGSVAVCGLLLALAGLHGAVAQAALARRREIAIRMAIGARPAVIARLMLLSSARPAVLGIGGGLVMAMVARRWVEVLSAHAVDSSVFAGAGATVLVFCLGAALIPSLKAARMDPARSLRDQ